MAVSRSSASEIAATSASTVVMPPARFGNAMVYDDESDRIIIFGGETDWWAHDRMADTWAYDLETNRWENMAPAVSPSPRLSPGMVYDPKANLVIAFGGNGWLPLQDTWTYDLNTNTWTKMNPSVSPPARIAGQMVYDDKRDQVIMFGGLSPDEDYALNDTWIYDLGSNNWTEVTTSVSPEDRCLGVAAYDLESDRMILFGGYRFALDNPDNETWIYNPSNHTWTNMTTAISPAPRFDAACAYDIHADRFLVFGGTPSGCDDMWAYDANAGAWAKVNLVSWPSDRLSTMTYDTKSDRTILFSGTWPHPHEYESVPIWSVNWTNFNETWVFDHGNRSWTMVLPDIVSPGVSITSPVNGASLTSRTVNLTGTASDNLEVAEVEVSLDNATWMKANGTTSWSATLSLSEGKNTIYVRVTDTSGNIATSTISVTAPSKGLPLWVWPVIAVGIALIAVTSYGLIRWNRKR